MRLIDADKFLSQIEDQYMEHDLTRDQYRDLEDRIAQQETIEERKMGWIPCSERLPEEAFGCIVTVWDTNPMTMNEFENILPYFVGWDGEQWNDADGEQCPFEVIAWMPLPGPYGGGDNK